MKRWILLGVTAALIISFGTGGYAVLRGPSAFDDAFTVQLEAPQEVALGAPVPMKVSLKNDSWRPARIYHGPPEFNIRVETPEGDLVWSWTAGRVFPLPLYRKFMRPGEVWEFEYAWEQHYSDCPESPANAGTPCDGPPVEPGEYVVYGFFLGDVVDPSDSDDWSHRSEGQVLTIVP